MKHTTNTKALIAAYRLVEYAKKQGAYTGRGGDHYIETGLVTEAVCSALSLDIREATVTDLENAIKEFES